MLAMSFQERLNLKAEVAPAVEGHDFLDGLQSQSTNSGHDKHNRKLTFASA